ncbi:hypothetical protein D3C78_1421910 [compost metagenome]
MRHFYARVSMFRRRHALIEVHEHLQDFAVGGAQVFAYQVGAMQALLPAFHRRGRLCFLGLRETRYSSEPCGGQSQTKLAEGVTGVGTQHCLSSS